MRIQVNDLSIHYEKLGKGPVLLFLHGWRTDLNNMKEIAKSCSQNYTVISLDFPGFGSSQQPETNWSVSQYSDFILEFLKASNIKTVYGLVGHSFGGRVILKLLGEKKLIVKRLILIASAGIKPKRNFQKTSYLLIAKIGKIILNIRWLRRFAAPAQKKLYLQVNATDYIQAGDMKDIFIRTINEDLSHYASKIVTPTLLIWGAEDSQTPLQNARYFHKMIQHSDLKIIQGAGHFVHNEKPKKVSRWIREFLH